MLGGARVAWIAVVALACTRTAPTSEPKPTAEAKAASAPDTSTAGDSEEARKLRRALVQTIEASGYTKSARILDAMGKVPRHLFVPEASLRDAYDDRPYPIALGQTISQPTLVAEMTDVLEVAPNHRVLEIGTGSGYQAAILSLLAADVYTIELLPELGARATRVLAELGYSNVHVRVGDGYAGWPELAPFDRIIVTAAPPELPKALLDQLADGGILVAPVGPQDEAQWLVRVKKKGTTLTRETIERVRFVPMIPKK